MKPTYRIAAMAGLVLAPFVAMGVANYQATREASAGEYQALSTNWDVAGEAQASIRERLEDDGMLTSREAIRLRREVFEQSGVLKLWPNGDDLDLAEVRQSLLDKVDSLQN